MHGPAKLASHIGLGMVIAGFVVIALAWNGAASLGHLQGQFPYLLSGGLGGLGLIGTGAGLFYVQAQRELAADEAARYARVIDGVRAAVVALGGGAAARSVAAPAAAPSANGGTRSESGTVNVVTRDRAEDVTIVTESDWSAGATETMVVVGRSSFHDASCHLVNSRDDLDTMPRAEAAASGLKACRVCKP